MESEPVATPELEKRSGGWKVWIILLGLYIVFCVAVFGVGGWWIYQLIQSEMAREKGPSATATALITWPVVYSNDFSKILDVWYVGSYTGEDYTETGSIVNGEYVWDLNSSRGYTFWQEAGAGPLDDFVLSGDVRHTKGSLYDEYGLIFHSVVRNHYLFLVSDKGNYAVYLFSTGNWNTLISPTRSSAIRAGENNHLVVQAMGKHYQLFINDTFVNEFEDDTLHGGDVGIAMSLDRGEGPPPATQQPQGVRLLRDDGLSTAIYDNLLVRAPQPVAQGTPHSIELPDIRPEPGKIVYVSDRGGDRNIYTINTDGNGVTQLTNDPAADYAPRWSPDGAHIAFVSRRDGNAEIYVMDADGKNLARLTDNTFEDASPDWSPDGKQIIFASRRGGNYDIYLMPVKGEKDGLIQLTTTKADEINPSISPDGEKIVYQSRKSSTYSLMVCTISGKGARNIVPGFDGVTSSQAAWSPDGARVVYIEIRESSQGDIFITDPAQHLTQNAGFSITGYESTSLYPAWSPKGDQIVFVSSRGGQSDIYIITDDGGGIFRVTHTEAVEESPDWTAR